MGAGQVGLGQLGEVIAQPVGHGDFLHQDALADFLGLLVAHRLRCGDKYLVGRDFEILEDISHQGALDDLVVEHHPAHGLPHRHHLAAEILEAGIGFVVALQAALDQPGLVLRFANVLLDARLEFGVMLDAAGLLFQHGFGLRLHRMGIAQPLDQAFGTDVVAGLCTLHSGYSCQVQ